MLFCLAITPLASQCRGFDSRHQPSPITHILYMDDIKLYEPDPEELQATVTLTENAAAAIGMELGVAKCGVAHLKRGRLVKRGGVATKNATIKEVGSRESYRYLGMEQLMGPKLRDVRRRVRKEYLRRV